MGVPSTIDYVLADCSLFSSVRSFKVLPITHLSDHCCISTSVKTNFTINDLVDHEPARDPSQNAYKPDALSLKIFQKALEINLKDYNDKNVNTVDEAVANLTNVITNTDNATVNRSKFKSKKAKSDIHGKPWFDNNCRSLKSKLNRARKELHCKPFENTALRKYLVALKTYKRILKRTEYSYKMTLKNKLDVLDTNEPRKYWQVIKKMRSWGKVKDSNEDIQPSKWISISKASLDTIPTTGNRGQQLIPFRSQPLMS